MPTSRQVTLEAFIHVQIQRNPDKVKQEQTINMTRQDVLNNLSNLPTDRQVQWMFDFGYQLTISARGAYTGGELDGDAARLMGFNELQHQVYGRSRQLRRGEKWTVESFLDTSIQKAKIYKIEGDLGSAIQASLRNLAS